MHFSLIVGLLFESCDFALAASLSVTSTSESNGPGAWGGQSMKSHRQLIRCPDRRGADDADDTYVVRKAVPELHKSQHVGALSRCLHAPGHSRNHEQTT